MNGFVSLVGAGPGDPGLLTVRAAERLAAADLVVYDRLLDRRLLERVPAGATVRYAGKRPQGPRVTQETIYSWLADGARRGQRVVRLKGGDPFVFGRGGEEALYLARRGIPYEIVPGVSSVTGVPAYAGVPLTHRGLSSAFAVVTGHRAAGGDGRDDGATWQALARGVDTLVILMGMGQLPAIARRLLAAGLEPERPAAVIEWGTWQRQRIVRAPLAELAARVEAAGLSAPGLIVVGPTVALAETLDWFAGQESEPLREALLDRPG